MGRTTARSTLVRPCYVETLEGETAVSYPRESIELVAMELDLDGTPLAVADAGNVELSVVPRTRPLTRPGSWFAVDTTDDGFMGVMIGPGTNHDYSGLSSYPVDFDTFGRYVGASPEEPVVYLGSFRVD